ncbi:MAG TPA: MBL fold metallo-hydrolase [Myxococcales bacterium]|jgi:glyoxylase-like metal-dependent hydrolase (beta-lactamase superfamily II)/ferredoxin
MADLNLRLPENAPGELFVDDTCIDCDTCRELAPHTFGSLRNGQSFVREQPRDDAAWAEALRALVSCPTASIGAERSAKEAARSLPVPIDDARHLSGTDGSAKVFRCGYSSESSYGAQSYFLVREDGNLLVDSPRAAAPLLKRLEELGGVRRMFLTHQDDVADHAAFRKRFGCERIIHEADDHIGAEIRLQGTEPRELAKGVVAIPVPGHTRGSCALLVDDTWLFTGDHLWADHPAAGASGGNLEMGRNVCWHSWPEQVRSLRRLLDYRFEHILPGHGRSLKLPRPAMRAEVEALLKRLG